MKQFAAILGFELSEYSRSKGLVITTLVFMLVIAVVLFFPRISDLFSDGADNAVIDEPGYSDELGAGDDSVVIDVSAGDRPQMLIAMQGVDDEEMVLQAFEQAFPFYAVFKADNDMSALEESVKSGEAECALALYGLSEYVYYVETLSMYDDTAIVVEDLLRDLIVVQAMTAAGISEEDAFAALDNYVSGQTISLGKDQAKNFFYTYIMIFALYMVILLYGQMVASNVAMEKSSRAMELLVTAARPTAMMFGKVIASCVAGLVQLTAIFGTAFVCFNLNRSYWDADGIIASLFDIPLSLLVYMLVFFLLGFLVYAFMFGAVGSVASRLEDISTLSMPITLLFIAAFIVVVFSMSSGMVDNPVMIACSYIPFTSPMAMFTRIAMSTAPLYEILLSVAVLIGSVFVIGFFAARIYRVGVLLYGVKPSLRTMWNAARKS